MLILLGLTVWRIIAVVGWGRDMRRDSRAVILPAAPAAHRRPTFPDRSVRIDNSARDNVPDTGDTAALHA